MGEPLYPPGFEDVSLKASSILDIMIVAMALKMSSTFVVWPLRCGPLKLIWILRRGLCSYMLPSFKTYLIPSPWALRYVVSDITFMSFR